MSVQPSPKESRTSMLPEDSRTLIQMMTEDWSSPYGQALSGDSLSILRSGINLISGMIDSTVRTDFVHDLTMESLGEGDGDVDLVALAIKVTKRMVKDVCAELKSNLPGS